MSMSREEFLEALPHVNLSEHLVRKPCPAHCFHTDHDTPKVGDRVTQRCCICPATRTLEEKHPLAWKLW